MYLKPSRPNIQRQYFITPIRVLYLKRVAYPRLPWVGQPYRYETLTCNRDEVKASRSFFIRSIDSSLALSACYYHVPCANMHSSLPHTTWYGDSIFWNFFANHHHAMLCCSLQQHQPRLNGLIDSVWVRSLLRRVILLPVPKMYFYLCIFKTVINSVLINFNDSKLLSHVVCIHVYWFRYM